MRKKLADNDGSDDDSAPPKKFENLITPTGYKRILDELMDLSKVQRPIVVEEVSAAAAQGDRSENAEYIYGKKKLREIDRRMNFLKSRLDKAKVIDPARQNSDKVEFGAHVTIEDEEGRSKTWFIIGEDEADPSSGKISWLSPIGKAMLNKKEGDFFEAHTPKGEILYTIMAIKYNVHT